MQENEILAFEAMERLCGDVIVLINTFLAEHESALDQENIAAWKDILDIADEQLQIVEEVIPF